MSVARGKQFTTLRNGAPYGVGVPAPYRTTCSFTGARGRTLSSPTRSGPGIYFSNGLLLRGVTFATMQTVTHANHSHRNAPCSIRENHTRMQQTALRRRAFSHGARPASHAHSIRRPHVLALPLGDTPGHELLCIRRWYASG